VALAIGSVSLFGDSVDFLEDTSVNFLENGDQANRPPQAAVVTHVRHFAVGGCHGS
jgi:hypothetical protein